MKRVLKFFQARVVRGGRIEPSAGGMNRSGVRISRDIETAMRTDTSKAGKTRGMK